MTDEAAQKVKALLDWQAQIATWVRDQVEAHMTGRVQAESGGNSPPPPPPG